tara:strand:+ start:4630 stop:5358 length:729 start_codon:yes stop_codon:yes gene_type:complete
MREIREGEINWDLILWKYFRPERFIDSLESGELYFAAANEFADPFEGAVAVQQNLPPPDPRYAEIEGVEKAFRELTRLTKLSCWHTADFESDAMWKLYAGVHKGIAIRTTPQRMRDAFDPFKLEPTYDEESLYAGLVEYLDLTRVRLRSAGNIQRFFVKHRAFEWEREFRLAISLTQAEENGVVVPEKGVRVSVDMNQLVERIILGTTITPDEREMVFVHAERLGFADRIEVSSLLGTPRYI